MDVEGRGRGLICYYPGICLGGLKKSTKNFGQNNRSSSLDLNPRPQEYKQEC
jgi:hypothetical protein